MMGYLGRHCWKCYVFLSLGCISQAQFFHSTTPAAAATTTARTKSPISSSEGPNSLSSLEDFLVGSLGFSKKQALDVSANVAKRRRLRTGNFLENAELVISLLQEKGLDKPQIRNLVYSAPQILLCRLQKNLKPKMKFFEDAGFSVSDFADIISAQPKLLGTPLNSTISPCVDALRTILGSNQNLVRAIKGLRLANSGCHINTKDLVSNVSSLRAKGIPIESIQKHIAMKSATFLLNNQAFEDLTAKAEAKWGVSPESSMFLYAVQSLTRLTEKSVESRFRLFESFGWERSQVVELFRKNPRCLTLSEGKLEAGLRFFMNELGCDATYIAGRPSLLGYSLEKRVVPRRLVVQVLKEKGLVKQELSLYAALTLSHSQFLMKFIQPYQNSVPISMNDICKV